MSVPFCASTACPLAQGVQKANTSHFSPSSPPSWSKAGWTPSPDLSIPSHSPPGSPPLWSKAGVWVERENGKHGSNCTMHHHFGFHPFPLSTRLSTLVVEIGSLGQKREWGAWLRLHNHFGFWNFSGPQRPTLASLPTLHPALHPCGRKRELEAKN
ncbi:hypothetical protein B0H13DRAFT_1852551 [Mycena leptocephala]|nr:hypothetical protein B0H13DRAFT_1852551 [Mycena leptocephala]